MVREIPVDEFTADNWARLAQTADNKCKPPRRFNPEYFFPLIQDMINRNVAKVWGNEERTAMLVSLFHNNLFSGDPIALNLFWVDVKGNTSLKLIRELHEEAARRGCIACYASAFRNHRSAAMTRLFRMLGYEPHEMGFIKML